MEASRNSNIKDGITFSDSEHNSIDKLTSFLARKMQKGGVIFWLFVEATMQPIIDFCTAPDTQKSLQTLVIATAFSVFAASFASGLYGLIAFIFDECPRGPSPEDPIERVLLAIENGSIDAEDGYKLIESMRRHDIRAWHPLPERFKQGVSVRIA